MTTTTREHRCPKCRSWDVVSSTSEGVYSSGLSAGEQHRYWCAVCEWEVCEGAQGYDDYTASERVPDVGDLVEYNSSRWRVQSWLLASPAPTGWQGFRRDGKRFTWCERPKATHLSLTGVCGAIAPIEECRVVGRVSWSKETIEQETANALRLVGEHVW